MPGGTKEDVALQLQYVEDLRAGFYAKLQKETNPFFISKILKLPKYKDWTMCDQWLEMSIWRFISDEFLGPYPWRPELPL